MPMHNRNSMWCVRQSGHNTQHNSQLPLCDIFQLITKAQSKTIENNIKKIYVIYRNWSMIDLALMVPYVEGIIAFFGVPSFSLSHTYSNSLRDILLYPSPFDTLGSALTRPQLNQRNSLSNIECIGISWPSCCLNNRLIVSIRSDRITSSVSSLRERLSCGCGSYAWSQTTCAIYSW